MKTVLTILLGLTALTCFGQDETVNGDLYVKGGTASDKIKVTETYLMRQVPSWTYSDHYLLRSSWTAALGDYLYLASAGNNIQTSDMALILGENNGLQFGKGSAAANSLSSTLFTISNSGKVGVGTSVPAGAVHISSATAEEAIVIGDGVLEASTRDNSIIFTEANTGDGDNGIRWMNGSGATLSALYGSVNGNASLGTATGDILFSPGSSEKMRIDADGNVGIGTASPAYQLDVKGTGRFSGFVELQNPQSLATTTLSEVIGNSAFSIKAHTSNSTRLAFGQTGTGATSTIQTTNGSSTASWHIALSPFGGNVGIGTGNSDPSYKLDVHGTSRFTQKMIVENDIESKKVKVSATPGSFPDYVFANGYQPMAISQLEEFIKTNGYLPNIPTATEVEANGQDLGLIQQKLLEKIEELTLYTIQQEKEIENLKSNIELRDTQYALLLKRIEKLETSSSGQSNPKPLTKEGTNNKKSRTRN